MLIKDAHFFYDLLLTVIYNKSLHYTLSDDIVVWIGAAEYEGEWVWDNGNIRTNHRIRFINTNSIFKLIYTNRNKKFFVVT